MIKFIKKHLKAIIIVLISVLAAVVIFAIPLLINIAYKTPSKIRILGAEWNAEDALQFYGAIIGAGGTIVLGYVAYWQTKRANEQSDNANEISNRLLSIEESRDKLELRPFIMVTDFKAYAKIECELINDPDQLYISVAPNTDFKGYVLCIEMTLANTTKSFITAEYYRAAVDDGPSWGLSAGNQGNLKIAINGGETGKVVFYAPSSFFESMRERIVRFRFILENRIGKRYAQEFDMIITSITPDTVGCSPTGKWFISMMIQGFSIARFDKDENGKNIEIKEEL